MFCWGKYGSTRPSRCHFWSRSEQEAARIKLEEEAARAEAELIAKEAAERAELEAAQREEEAALAAAKAAEQADLERKKKEAAAAEEAAAKQLAIEAAERHRREREAAQEEERRAGEEIERKMLERQKARTAQALADAAAAEKARTGDMYLAARSRAKSVKSVKTSPQFVALAEADEEAENEVGETAEDIEQEAMAGGFLHDDDKKAGYMRDLPGAADGGLRAVLAQRKREKAAITEATEVGTYTAAEKNASYSIMGSSSKAGDKQAAATSPTPRGSTSVGSPAKKASEVVAEAAADKQAGSSASVNSGKTGVNRVAVVSQTHQNSTSVASASVPQTFTVGDTVTLAKEGDPYGPLAVGERGTVVSVKPDANEPSPFQVKGQKQGELWWYGIADLVSIRASAVVSDAKTSVASPTDTPSERRPSTAREKIDAQIRAAQEKAKADAKAADELAMKTRAALLASHKKTFAPKTPDLSGPDTEAEAGRVADGRKGPTAAQSRNPEPVLSPAEQVIMRRSGNSVSSPNQGKVGGNRLSGVFKRITGSVRTTSSPGTNRMQAEMEEMKARELELKDGRGAGSSLGVNDAGGNNSATSSQVAPAPAVPKDISTVQLRPKSPSLGRRAINRLSMLGRSKEKGEKSDTAKAAAAAAAAVTKPASPLNPESNRQESQLAKLRAVKEQHKHQPSATLPMVADSPKKPSHVEATLVPPGPTAALSPLNPMARKNAASSSSSEKVATPNSPRVTQGSGDLAKRAASVMRKSKMQTVAEIEAGAADDAEFEPIDPRALDAAKWTDKEIRRVISEIKARGYENGDRKPEITFGQVIACIHMLETFACLVLM